MICQWNAAFDRYMRNKFHQCFPMHPLMACHIADLSTAFNSQFLDYCLTERRLQRMCHASIHFQTLHSAAVQQFNTLKDLSQQDLQFQIAIDTNCHQYVIALIY